MPAGLQLRLGGSVASHGRRAGVWFDPSPWAVLAALITWLLCMWHQSPCQQTVAGEPVNAFMRLCYSDIPVLYQTSGLATGGTIYTDVPLDYPVVLGFVMALTRGLPGLKDGNVAGSLSDQQVLDAANQWFVLNAVVLFVAFIAMVLTHLRLGSDSSPTDGGGRLRRGRSWEALYIAAAPVVAAAGLVNWDLLGAALTSFGVLLWAGRRPGWAGVVIGLTVATKVYPVVVLLGIVLLCLRAGQRRAMVKMTVAGTLTWLVLNAPVAVMAPGAWAGVYHAWFQRGAELGSVWFILADAGVSMRWITAYSTAAMLVGLSLVTRLVLVAPRRPRLAQVVFLLLVVVLVTNKNYAPQYVLWILPFVVLARPRFADWAVFNVAELLYFWAVWAHLEGSSAPGGGSLDTIYWFAILLRTGALVWIFTRVLHDVRHPWDDPVRRLFIDDPLGGVLDHSADAGYGTAIVPKPEKSFFDHDPDATVDEAPTSVRHSGPT